jgi:hypothetical protein
MTAESRITERIESRRKAVQMVMEANPDVKWVADKLREVFSAKLIYLQSGDVVYGNLGLGVPIGLMQIKPKSRKKQ